MRVLLLESHLFRIYLGNLRSSKHAIGQPCSQVLEEERPWGVGTRLATGPSATLPSNSAMLGSVFISTDNHKRYLDGNRCTV